MNWWLMIYDAFILISFVQLLILMLLLVIAADWSAWIDHVTIFNQSRGRIYMKLFTALKKRFIGFFKSLASFLDFRSD